MAYLFGWKPRNVREDVLQDRFRRAGISIRDLDKRFYSQGYTDGFTGVIRTYDHFIDIALNSLETELNQSRNSSYTYRRKRVIARVSRDLKKKVFSPEFFMQLTRNYNN